MRKVRTEVSVFGTGPVRDRVSPSRYLLVYFGDRGPLPPHTGPYTVRVPEKGHGLRVGEEGVQSRSGGSPSTPVLLGW